MTKQPGLFASEMECSAVISPCGLYRYELRRTWDDTLPKVAVCMLNPSKADATVTDPTITKLIGFARRWGYGGFVVVNLYAWRSTESKNIGICSEHVGPDNDSFILNAAMMGGLVCGWGPKPHIAQRVRQVTAMLRKFDIPMRRIGAPSKDGSPCHPLMLPYSRTLELMEATP